MEFKNKPEFNEQWINEFAQQIGCPKPQIWESKYRTPRALLHHVGHWAIMPQWAKVAHRLHPHV